MENLLSETPIARNTDPITSHISAHEITYSGSRTTQQIEAFQLVAAYPGHTSRELAFFGELDRYQMARRLSDLEHAGLVTKGPIRKDETNLRMAVTWLVA